MLQGNCTINGVGYRYEIEELKTVFRVFVRRVGWACPCVFPVSVKRSEIPPYEITGFPVIDRHNMCREIVRAALTK